jgi:glycosyltransferase involved in cell wall biosynthesis
MVKGFVDRQRFHRLAHNMAVIDILVPCYRYGRFLPGCIGSILSQSVQDFRVLIIDDASPDDSAAVAEHLAHSDSRIKVIAHRTNQGHIATYNEGIAWTSSPYFLLLSADDFLAPGALARAVAIMEARDDVVMTYGTEVRIQSGQPTPAIPEEAGETVWNVRPGRDFVAETCDAIRNVVPTPTVIVRTAVQKRIGGYHPHLNHAGDLEMWLRFAAHGSVAATSSVQAFYRMHGNNMSTAIFETLIEDYEQRRAAFDTFFAGDGARLAGAGDLHKLASRRLGDAAFWTGAAQIGRGNLQTGRKLLHFAWRLNPKTRLWPPFGHLRHVSNPGSRALTALYELRGKRKQLN